MCGEKVSLPLLKFRKSGSPPRVRGKDQHRARERAESGITPACAGKSSPGFNCSSGSWDHPRVCGEKPDGFARLCTAKGSPPRVRGKGRCLVDHHPVPGITPACAGKRRHDYLLAGEHSDHPRVCGEKGGGVDYVVEQGRSPPRVRGKESDCCEGLLAKAITPACAGKRVRCHRS